MPWCMQVASGSRVSGHLVAALEVLQGGSAAAAVAAAVAAMCWAQLARMPTSLLQDLAMLLADACACGGADGDAVTQQLLGLLVHYAQGCGGWGATAHRLPPEPFAYTQLSTSAQI